MVLAIACGQIGRPLGLCLNMQARLFFLNPPGRRSRACEPTQVFSSLWQRDGSASSRSPSRTTPSATSYTTGRVRRLRAFLDAIIHPRTVTMNLRVGPLAKECLTMADTRVHVRHLNSFPRFAICRSSNTSKWKPTPNSAGSATMSTRPCRQHAETAANLDAWQGLHLKPLFF